VSKTSGANLQSPWPEGPTGFGGKHPLESGEAVPEQSPQRRAREGELQILCINSAQRAGPDISAAKAHSHLAEDKKPNRFELLPKS